MTRVSSSGKCKGHFGMISRGFRRRLLFFSIALVVSGFYPYTWWAWLAPSGGEFGWVGVSFDKVVNQNFLFVFHWANYTLNKTLPGEGRSLKWRGKLESKIGGTWAQNWGKLRPILIPDLEFGGIEATACCFPVVWMCR